MYNEQVKSQYLEEKRVSAKISNNLVDVFKLSERKETELDKDICEWNSREILDFYRYYSTPYINSLIKIHNDLRNYTVWCIMNGLVRDGQNHYDEINSERLCECIDFEKLRKFVISREELLKIINPLPMVVDKFIFLALFEGVPLTDGCLIKLKMSDLCGNKLFLANGDYRDVSDELVIFMRAADDEEEYIPAKYANSSKKYVPSQYIIKVPVDSKVDARTFLIYRNKKALSYIERDGLTMKNVMESGRFEWAMNKAATDHISFEEAILRNKATHERIWGRVQNYLTYVKIYGRIAEMKLANE